MLICAVAADSLGTPGIVAHQVVLFKGFLGKNTGVGCPFLLQVSDPEVEPPVSPYICSGFFTH